MGPHSVRCAAISGRASLPGMSLLRRTLLTIAVLAAICGPLVGILRAQAPAPVPALPDTARLTQYSIVSSTCACAVNFALYGDSTDYQDWLEVFLNGVRVNYNDPTYGWAITSPSGTLGSIALPITDAVLTFTSLQTGTVTIVGADRPRRLTQFTEGRGVAARDLNQAFTGIVAGERETWDKINDVTGRAILGLPGESLSLLPEVSLRKNTILGFDGNGNPQVTSSGSPPPFSSIAAYQLLANPTGSSAAPVGTGASAFFDAAYCNTIGYWIVRFTSAWTCAQGIPANPVWWGADPTGTNDSTSAFNSAAAAFGTTGGSIAFPAGKFKFLSQPTITFPATSYSITITGAGQDATILYWPNTSGGIPLAFSSCMNSIHIRDLSFTTGVANGGTAVALSQTANCTGAKYAQNDFFRVTFRGDDGGAATDYWTKGVSISAVWAVNFDTIMTWGSSGNLGKGITLVGTGSNNYSIEINIDKSIFQNAAEGIEYGNYVQGVNVNMSNFNGPNGITIDGTSGTLSQLFISNDQFNNSNTAINALAQIYNLQVVNSQFFVSASGIGIEVGTDLQAASQISNNWFIGQSSSANIGIQENAPGFAGGTVIGNIFDALIYGLNVNGATNLTVANNQFISTTNPIVNIASGDVITGNLGYNPVGTTSLAYPLATTSLYTAGASPETEYLVGGTVTEVELGSTSICASTPCQVNLGPNETMTVVYSGKPSLVRSIH